MGKHTGKCLCGDVTLQVTGKPVMQENRLCRETVTVLTVKKHRSLILDYTFFQG